MTDQPEFDPRFDSAFQRGFDGPAPAAAPPARTAEEPAPSAARPALTADEPAPDPSGLRRNPWFWALWVVAIVFTVGAIAFEVLVIGDSLVPVSSVGTPTSVYIMPLVVSSLAPWFLGAGLAAFVGVLLLSAVRWRTRA